MLHEWALAEAVTTAALEAANKEGLGRVTEVFLKVGELQGIELEIMEFALSAQERQAREHRVQDGSGQSKTSM